MKTPPPLMTLAWLCAAPFAGAAEINSRHAPADAQNPAETTMPSAETAAQIEAMPACKATVEEHAPCYAVFRTADGKKFSIGSPAATQDVVQFLQTLKDGATYEFPRVFLEYR